MILYIIGLGIIFDLITLRAIILSVAEKKYRPGVPLISLACYCVFFVWELMICLDAGEFANPYLLLAGALIIIHILLHMVSHMAKKKYS